MDDFTLPDGQISFPATQVGQHLAEKRLRTLRMDILQQQFSKVGVQWHKWRHKNSHWRVDVILQKNTIKYRGGIKGVLQDKVLRTVTCDGIFLGRRREARQEKAAGLSGEIEELRVRGKKRGVRG